MQTSKSKTVETETKINTPRQLASFFYLRNPAMYELHPSEIIITNRAAWVMELVDRVLLLHNSEAKKVAAEMHFETFSDGQTHNEQGVQGYLTAALKIKNEPNFSSDKERAVWFEKIRKMVAKIADTDEGYIAVLDGRKVSILFPSMVFCKEFGDVSKDETWHAACEYTTEKRDKIMAFIRHINWVESWYNDAVSSYNKLRSESEKKEEDWFSKVGGISIEDLMSGKKFP